MSIYYVIAIIIGVLVGEVIIVGALMYRGKKKTEASIRIATMNDATERLKMYINHDFDKIDSRIDTYIDEAGKMYKMNNFEYQDPDKLYLTEEMMNEMIKSLTKEVMKKITPAVFAIMQLSYNLNTESDLISFLYEKIKLYVLSYSLETNAEIESE